MSSFSANTSMRLALRTSTRWTTHDCSIEEEVLNLFDLMCKRLLRYAVSFGISVQDGEDIVQEVFLALFHHLQQNRSNDNLYGWLFRVTHNLALKSRLKTVREPAVFGLREVERLDPDPDPEARMLFGERYTRLQAALHALPPDDQLCLWLRSEGLRYREIAKIVGISLGSVSASLSRSLARLEQADRR
jgi:RNA polymerase sigma-70 factor (ECF subfamily)